MSGNFIDDCCYTVDVDIDKAAADLGDLIIKRAAGYTYTKTRITKYSDTNEETTEEWTKRKTPNETLGLVLLFLRNDPMKLAVACGYKNNNETE